MRILIAAVALAALLMGCSTPRQSPDNRDPCLDFGARQSPAFNACLERRANALKAVFKDSNENQREFVSETKVDP
ncbi:hypothetical protein [Pseudomonas sp. Q1]|uniref:hypothetical protein n=1 Tax=Pseudomonas sp. Q1 TaxID=2202823 RepID=UPI001374A94B|nr:hypothetical protein [Pseudomonas sp. Q1]